MLSATPRRQLSRALLSAWRRQLAPQPRRGIAPGRGHAAKSGPLQVADVALALERDPKLLKLVARSVDPEVAEQWLKTRRGLTRQATDEAEERAVAKPTLREFRQLFLFHAVPFVGFGFFDNMIMLTVGEAIDITLGATLGFGTLMAAGLGQCASDSVGISLQGIIERFADRLGLPDPKLSPAQRRMHIVGRFIIAARIVGIVVGCLIGMFPLLFVPKKRPSIVGLLGKDLDLESRQELVRHVFTKEFAEGSVILRFGQIGRYVCLVVDGEVQVLGRDDSGTPFTVTTLSEGHTFGKTRVYEPSRCDLVASSEGAVIDMISKEDYLRIVKDEKKIESYRSPEQDIYFRLSKAPTMSARKGAGKSREFANLSEKEKLQVLGHTGLEEARRFQGVKFEGKVAFFASLTETQKRDALNKFYVDDWEFEDDDAEPDEPDAERNEQPGAGQAQEGA